MAHANRISGPSFTPGNGSRWQSPRWMVIAILVALLMAAAPAHALVPLSNVVQLAAGLGHTCALTSGGGVKCWGDNSYGQLGDTSTGNSPTPVDVFGLGSGVSKIAAGQTHTCAVTTAGGVKCWGSNYNGQLGDNSTTYRYAPVDVIGLSSGVGAIAAGRTHTCAVTAVGGVKCWGSNNNGQLGDNSTTDRLVPVDVVGLSSGVSAIAADAHHTCALTTAGGVKCWGNGGYGQLGNGLSPPQLTPVDVSGLSSGIVAIAAGFDHTCALTTAGGVKCWGHNIDGQLGDGTQTTGIAPVDVMGLTSGVSAIAAGDQYTCALTTTGGVKCWGGNNDGRLGDGSFTARFAPADVAGLSSGVSAIVAGIYHTCAVTTAGGAKCWGQNSAGQLGDNWQPDRTTPVDVTGLTGAVGAIATGSGHTCALNTGGGLKCWGWNGYGQLGDNSNTDRITPTDVTGLASGGAAITAGDSHTCTLTMGGGVKCWGNNDTGQLGDNSVTRRPAPVDVTGLSSGVAAVAAGGSHTCALTTGGGVKCWGLNAFGQLGDNSTTNHLTPIEVTGLASGVAAIAAGDVHTCALTTAGGVKCWGYNGSGQLGDNSTTNRLTPVDVEGLTSGVSAISTTAGHFTCAVTTVGGVKCWGANGYGQLGDGSTTDRLTPVDVTGISSGVSAIAAGGSHTCALSLAGAVKCWGNNDTGQLGDNSRTQRLAPVDVVGLAGGVNSISARNSHSCAVVSGGGVKCWGWNSYSQLGDGTGSVRPFPANVLDRGPQSITFAPIPDRVLAAGAFTVLPTATSGLTVSLSTATMTVCSVSGFTITPLADGVCTIHADQAGNSEYLVAPRVSRTFNVLGDTTPDPFSFTSVTGASPGSVVTSGSATIGGINAPAAISVTDGAYSIGCTGTFTTSAGSITNGQTVCVRHPASASYATAVTTTLTIGGVSAGFTSTTIAQPVTPPIRGDANGDRKAELFWADGPAVSWWLMDGAALKNTTYYEAPAGWSLKEVGDINGDGRADLIWRRDADGATYAWLVVATGFSGFVDLGVVPTSFTLVGAADLDGDGVADLVWRDASGLVYGWLMSGGTIASQGVIASPAPAWVLVDMADMDGDGKADLVFRHATTGEVWVRFMNGLATAGQGSAGVLDAAAWHLEGAADFDGDGKADLLWRSTAGDTWVWRMNGTALVSAGGIGNPGAGWSVKSLGDFDGDGKTDLLWRHTDGTTYLWTMNGTSVSAYLPVANPGGSWQPVAP